ncbi:MAG: hypothetical protein KatS3mg057_2276 [Herpetosiphonaceae bacterium]|nr:MAG: hypothetical protein KatS3mg057_2276 [Herpetosiphonaceae bacterium]
MSDLKSFDVGAGYDVIGAFTASEELLNSMFTTVQSAQNNLASTWHGNSKAQFDGEWSAFATMVSTVIQRMGELKVGLNNEIREVETTFSS